MAVGTGITEIADSDDEPLTSSPAAVSDAAVDKLSATACQDAQAVACPHQELAENTANQVSSHTDLLDADQKKPSSDVEITRFDQSDSLSAHDTATDNASEFAVDAPLQVHTSACGGLNATAVDEQDVDTGVNTADGEASSLLGAETSPQATPASGFGDQAISQISQEAHLNEPQDRQQPQLQERGLDISAVVDVPQVSPSTDCVPSESITHGTMLKPSHIKSAHLASTEQEPSRHIDASAVSQEDMEATDNDCLAAEPCHHITDEATIQSPISTHTDRADVTADSSETIPVTASISDLMELDAWPGAAGLFPSDASPGQHEIAALLAPQDGVNATDNPAVGSSELLAGDELITTHRVHKAGGHASFIPGSKRIENCHTPTEQQKRKGESNETANPNPQLIDAASVRGSATASDQQVREGVHPTAESDAGQPTEATRYSLHNALQTQYEHGQAEESDRVPAITLPEAQTEAHSTASQVSEPSSPRPAAELSPQEITLVELRAQKAALLASLRVQPAIQVVMEEIESSDTNLSENDGEPTEAEIMAAANKIVKEHIKLLHDYNELKDVGQGLMGIIADQRGVRIVEIQDEFGIDADD